MLWTFNPDSVDTWAVADKVFTADECKKIIEIGNLLPKKDALINEYNNTLKSNNDYRKNKVSWISPNQNINWLYEKLANNVLLINKNFFNFDLYGFTEDFQFTIYNEIGDHYKMHIDKSYKRNVRKLSIVVQLSDPNTYEGSELNIYHSESPDVMNKNQGSVIVFPSYALHKVTPLIKGVRYSLVAWVGGPPFK